MSKNRKSIIVEIEQELCDLLKEVRGQSATLYVRDTWWRRELRLLTSVGIEVSEPMHCFLPAGLMRQLAMAKPFEFFDYTTEVGRASRPHRHPFLLELAKSNNLYGDFVQRERIRRCIRMVLNAGGSVDAALFINYRRATQPPKKVAALGMNLLASVRSRGSQIDKALSSSPISLGTLAKVLAPFEAISSIAHKNYAVVIKRVFDDLLEALFDAFNLSTERDLGTVHLFDQTNSDLILRAVRGEGARPLPVQPANVGLLGWIALTKLGLLVQDLTKSKFGGIYQETGKPARSVLAVPMIVDNTLVGTVNLESHAPDAFCSKDVRLMWCAANQAAIANRLAEEAKSSSESQAQLREMIALQASSATEVVETAIAGMAIIGREHLRADRCDIWMRPEKGSDWRVGGSSPKLSEQLARPRREGWSAFCADHGVMVLLDAIQGERHYSSHVWKNIEQRWTVTDEHLADHPEINMGGVGESKCQLVMPCIYKNKVEAVCWFSFHRSLLDSELGEHLYWLWIFGSFVGQAVDRVSSAASEAKAANLERIASLFNREPVPTMAGLSIAVRTSPAEASLGGDFVAFMEQPSARRLLVLVADAESHGLPAALRMLPLRTAFKIIAHESGSPKHVVERLDWSVKHINEVRATAICLSIEMADGDEGRLEQGKRKAATLFVSSAGHPSLAIVFADGQSEWFPFADYDDSQAAAGPMIGLGQVLRVGAAARSLASGDVVIAYTDGISEARNGAGKQWGNTEMMRVANSLRGESPQCIADAIYEGAVRHSGKLEDDATVLVIRIDDVQQC